MSIYVGDFYPLHTGFGDSLSSIYNFYIDFNYSDVYLTTSSGAPIADEDGITLTISDPVQPIDRISKLDLITDGLAAGRPSYEGIVFDQDYPVVTPEGLLEYGNYENLISWSEDLTQGKTSFGLTVGIDSILSTSTSTALYQSTLIVAGEYYTESIIAKALNSNFVGMTFGGSSFGGNYVIFNLSTGQIDTQVGGTASIKSLGSGNYLCTFTSVSVITGSNALNVYWPAIAGGSRLESVVGNSVSIFRSHVTKSAYPLPYIKTEATTVAVPANNAGTGRTIGFPINEPYDASLSDDEGAWNRCRENLLNALDGVADGPDLIDGWDFTSGWLKTAVVLGEPNIIDSNTFSTTNIGGLYLQNLTVGRRYQVSIKYNTTASDFAVHNSLTAGNRISFGEGIFRFTAVSNEFYLRNYSGGETTVEELILQEVPSSAQGTIEVEWTPMFDAGEVGGDNNILSFDGTVNNSGIWYDDVAEEIKASDGTNTASASVSPVSGTEYNITLAYDVTNGMILSVEEAN